MFNDLRIIILLAIITCPVLTKTIYIKLDWGSGYWPKQELDAVFARHGYRVQETRTLANLTDVAFIMCYDVPTQQLAQLAAYPKEKCILVLWEPPVIKPANYNSDLHRYFGKIFTVDNTLVDNKTYFQCYYTVRRPMIDSPIPFSQKKFCTLINRSSGSSHPLELLTKRMQAITFFEHNAPQQLDVFGHGWDTSWKTTRGPIPGNHTSQSKIDVLKQYKFCLCYENTAMPGYITEKIFDCFHAGCVPIYLGAPNVTNFIPATCFIDPRNYSSWSELYTYLTSISESHYQTYIDHINTFLASSASKHFTNETYVNTLVQVLLGENL